MIHINKYLENIFNSLKRTKSITDNSSDNFLLSLIMFSLETGDIRIMQYISRDFSAYLMSILVDLYAVGKITNRLNISNIKEFWMYAGEYHTERVLECLVDIFDGKIVNDWSNTIIIKNGYEGGDVDTSELLVELS